MGTRSLVITVIVTALLAALLSSGATYLLLSSQLSQLAKQTPYTPPVTTQTQPPLSQPTSPVDETASTEQSRSANWKTYTNEKFHFELKYPEDWIIEDKIPDGPSGERMLSDWITLMPKQFQKDKRDMGLDIAPINVGRESVFGGYKDIIIEEAVFAGKKAKIYSCPKPNTCPNQLSYSKAIKLIDYPKTWGGSNEIGFALRKDYQYLIPIYNQILSTFTFD